MITVYSLAAFMPTLKGVIRDIRTVWTLEELGEPYERKVMNGMEKEHKAPAYLAINPFGKVPAIKDGEFTLFESSAIVSYLCDKKGKLIPKPATKERAIYDQWMAFAISSLEPQAARVFGYDNFSEKSPAGDAMRSEALSTIDGMLAVLDKELAKRPHIAGEAFMGVDIMLCAVIKFFDYTGVTEKHANVAAYLKRCFSRPAFKRAFENNG